MVVALFVLFLNIVCISNGEESVIISHTGHYPPSFCEVSNAWLDADTGVFHYHGDASIANCALITNVWKVQGVNDKEPNCQDHFKEGYTFTIYFWAYGSNYYHMHYDVLIPMYQQLHYNEQNRDPYSTVLMPVVESSRLNVMKWDTIAFDDSNKWWMQLLRVLTGNYTLLPLNDKVRQAKKNICFDKLYFSAPSYKKTDSKLIHSFVRFIKESQGIKHEPWQGDNKLMIISRKGRRQLKNEKEMAAAVKDLLHVDIVDFDGMSFKQQVEVMQEYNIMVGLNGAGFMNALYLPPGGVAIQLAPYKANLNINQFGELIKNRGPYLEWYNTHEENHHPKPGDKGNNHPDTTVHLGEFRELIQEAMKLAKAHNKDEL